MNTNLKCICVCFPRSPLGYFDRKRPHSKSLSWPTLTENELSDPEACGQQTREGAEAHEERTAGVERGGIFR